MIIHNLGGLDKNRAKILTKSFRNMQDSWQELQDILHWERFYTFKNFEDKREPTNNNKKVIIS